MHLIRFALLFVAAWFVLHVLPIVGPLASRLPILALLASASLAAWAARGIEGAIDTRRIAGLRERELARQDSGEARGKLGSMLLSRPGGGRTRARRAAELLEAAAAEDPERAEWSFRLGQARSAAGDPSGAVRALEHAVELDPEHGFGAAMLELARAQLAAGDAHRSLEALGQFERNHGPSSESAYRRGLAHRALGEREQASVAYREAQSLADDVPGFNRTEARRFALRAWMRSLLPG